MINVMNLSQENLMASHNSNPNPQDDDTITLFHSFPSQCRYLLHLQFNLWFILTRLLQLPLKNYNAPLSSYESLDKFNCISETLKITDEYHQQKHNIINTMNLIPIPSCEIISTSKVEHKASSPIKHSQPSQIQSMNNNHKIMSGVGDDANSRNSSMKRRGINDDDYDLIPNPDDVEVALNKQKHLSDWYYIKTSPKPKPSSPYERRKVKNFLHHPPTKITESYNNRSSTDKISSLTPFIPIQKYRSNDYIEQHNQPLNVYEDKSPLQSYKCFSMKYSKNPSGRCNETKFGEMTSSSFEHVNVTGLYDNRFSESDLRNDDDYVQSLRMAAAKMRPLPLAPTSGNKLESQVCC